MRLSCTVMEIWHHKDNGVTSLTFWGHVTRAQFLWVVHGDHASILHHYRDVAPQILDARIWTQKERWKNGKRKKKGEGTGRKNESKKKGKERRRRKGMESKGKEKEKRKENGKGKGKGRWKKDSLRNVKHTDARTDTKVILYSVQCYALHWTDNK